MAKDTFSVRVHDTRVRTGLKAMADPRVVGIEAGNDKAAQTAVSAVRREAPVRSGALQGSIRVEKGRDGTNLQAGDSVATYVPVTLGGRTARAPYAGNPFIKRGIDKTEKERLKGYNEAIRRAIRKLGFGL